MFESRMAALAQQFQKEFDAKSASESSAQSTLQHNAVLESVHVDESQQRLTFEGMWAQKDKGASNASDHTSGTTVWTFGETAIWPLWRVTFSALTNREALKAAKECLVSLKESGQLPESQKGVKIHSRDVLNKEQAQTHLDERADLANGGPGGSLTGVVGPSTVVTTNIYG